MENIEGSNPDIQPNVTIRKEGSKTFEEIKIPNIRDERVENITFYQKIAPKRESKKSLEEYQGIHSPEWGFRIKTKDGKEIELSMSYGKISAYRTKPGGNEERFRQNGWNSGYDVDIPIFPEAEDRLKK